ncbi:MAG: thioesterase family protein [Bdellovibrionota bacterium]
MESTGTDNKPLGILKGSHRISIYYEDTDFSGYVYHANYLKFFERAREHIFGADYLRQLYEENFHFVVANAELRYKRPAVFGDMLEIISVAPFTTSPIIDFKQEAYIRSKGNASTDGKRPIVEANIRLVSINQQGKPTSIPQFVLEHLINLSENPNVE